MKIPIIGAGEKGMLIFPNVVSTLCGVSAVEIRPVEQGAQFTLVYVDNGKESAIFSASEIKAIDQENLFQITSMVQDKARKA